MVLSRGLREGILKFCTTRLSSVSGSVGAKQRKRVQIPCPWGHISGVWWGREDVQPILAVHGWLDNAGSWKKLAQHLVDENTSLLALDLPGTGQSSHLKPFYNYHFSSSAAILRRVQKYFNFKDLVVFGHSGGSAATLLFSSLYPDIVKAYLGVDYVLYCYKRECARAEVVGEVLDEFIDLALKGKSTKQYSYEEAKQAWIHGSLLGATNPELIEDLMEGGMETVGDKYLFSRDLRLKHLKAVSVSCFSVEEARALARSLTCHVCLIKATDSPYFNFGIRNLPNIVDIIEETADSFQIHELKGHHHIQMEQPEAVAAIARSFLNSLS